MAPTSPPADPTIIAGRLQPRPAGVRARRGARLYTAEGEAYLDCLAGIATTGLGHAHPKLVAGAEGPGREALARLQHLPHSRPGGAGRAALTTATFADVVFFTNSGHRGGRVRAEDGAQVSLGQRPAGADRDHRLRGRLPRPQLRGGLRRRQPGLPRGLRPARCPAIAHAAVRRHGGAGGGRSAPTTAAVHHRAGAGRGRRARAAGSRPHRHARAVRRDRRAADL